MSLRMFSKLIENVLKLRGSEQKGREDVRVWQKLNRNRFKKELRNVAKTIFQEKEHLLCSLLSVKQ
jgi:hypothetical protein